MKRGPERQTESKRDKESRGRGRKEEINVGGQGREEGMQLQRAHCLARDLPLFLSLAAFLSSLHGEGRRGDKDAVLNPGRGPSA